MIYIICHPSVLSYLPGTRYPEAFPPSSKGVHIKPHQCHRDLQYVIEKYGCSLDCTRHSSSHDARASVCLTQCLFCYGNCERAYRLKVRL